METTQKVVIDNKLGDVTPKPEPESKIETPKTEVEKNEKAGQKDSEVFDNYKKPITENKAEKTAEEIANEEKEKQVQSKKDNERFARERREKEAREKEIKAVEQKAYERGLVEAVKGINPYTKEKIEDSHDIQEFLTMREIEASGLDPITDYHKYLKTQAREKIKTETLAKQAEAPLDNEEARKNWAMKDGEAFATKYPEVDLNKLGEDPNFIKFAKRQLYKVPLADIYESYVELTTDLEANTDKKIREKVAKVIASPGSVQSSGTNEPALLTMEQIKKMSQQEVAKNLDFVQKSLAHNLKAKK